MDKATFRQNYPEFADTTKYPDSMLTYHMQVAGIYVDAAKWGDFYDVGMSLVLAHNLVIAANNAAGNPGASSGLVNSQGAGPLSVSFDTGATAEANAGMWNLTTYGQQYIRLARMIGGVGLQL